MDIQNNLANQEISANMVLDADMEKFLAEIYEQEKLDGLDEIKTALERISCQVFLLRKNYKHKKKIIKEINDIQVQVNDVLDDFIEHRSVFF